MTWDEGLEGPALQIASTPKSPLCVVAGPGTGKTFALMRRLTRLLEVNGADPGRILACTFTRTAAEDIARAVAELGVDGTDEIVTQTVHGFCFSMLSREDVLTSTGRVPRPLLRFEERFLMQDLQRAGLGGVRDTGAKLRAFSAAWARLQHEQPGWPRDANDRAFQSSLLAWLRFHRAMLIGELIPEGIKYLRQNPESRFRNAFDHVLVDEYQDLNRAEQALVDFIASGTVVVIGDEDQSIYSFKHAHPEGIVEYPDTHPNTELAGLDTCRRCPHIVVDLANSLIQHNTSRSNRQLVPFEGNDMGDVFVVQWPSMEAEAKGLAAYVLHQIHEDHVQAGDVMILAPRREFGYLIRDELVAAGVPAHSFFSEELLEGNPKQVNQSDAQQVLSLLTLLASPDDRVALRCWCGFGHTSLAAPGWHRLRQYCEAEGDSPRKALDAIVADDLTIPYTQHLAVRFRLLRDRAQELRDLSGQDLVDAVLPADQEWANALREIAADIDEEDFGPAEFADVIRRNVSQPDFPTDVEYVRVMSLHKSKGLTSRLVIVAGCLDGLIPTVDDRAPDAEQARILEEQRRLFYVAITRTRQTLILSSVTGIPIALAHRMRARTNRTENGIARTVTSNFIYELGPSCPNAVNAQDFLDEVISGEK
ncbi:MAG: ATP-dependent helicase [Phycisphaerales bacterium]|nr:ATP-dependent helicase [Phycisphaerales bacterium]